MSPSTKSTIVTTEHFDDRIDILMKEIQDMREEQTILTGQNTEINERLERLEADTGLEHLE